MAIDKNSKAYQNLLNSGYSDQQITDMYNQASSWQSRQEVVANTKPVNTPTTQPTTPVEQPTEQPTQTTPEVKQETEIKQQETAGSTVPEIQQQGELKPLSQDYYNQTSQEAQDKIVKNLNDYKQSNPEYFTDYESFKRNFSYDARDDIQKNTLDEWYKWYQQGLEFSTTPVNDLYNQYNSGQLSATQLQSLRVTDPTKYAELQAQINKWNIIAAYDDDKWDATNMSFQDMAYQMMQKTFMQFMNWWSDSGATQFFAEYKDRMNSPEMVKLSDESAELQEQIENVQSDIANMKKAVEKEYAGTWATRSKINAIISDRTYELQTQLQTLDSQYKRVATQYNNRMQQYSSDFELQLQEYQLWMQERNQKMDELWFAMDLMSFETPQQQQERQWDYWVKQQEYTNWNINSKDYQTRYKAALKSVQNLLAQYEGIPMQRSAEQMAQDILTAIDNGSDLGAELTKINKQIQGKPEYKYLYNQTFKPAATSSWTSLQSYKVWDTEYVVYNGEMMTAEDFNSKYWGKAAWSTWEAKPYDIVDASVFDMWDWYQTKAWTLWAFLSDPSNASKKTWGWCGAFVNKYLKSIWVTNQNYYDDSLETKLNSVNTQIPKVWSIAVYDYWHITKETWKNHGHVWIVTKVYEDWSYDVIDSNFGSDKKIQVRQHLNPQSSNCKWFFDPSQPPAWSNTTDVSTSTLSNQDQQKASAMLKQIRSWAMTNSDMSSARDWLIENGYWAEFEEALDKGLKLSLSDAQIRVKNDANNTFKTNSIVKEFEESVNQIEQLQTALNDASWVWDMSAIFTFMKTLDPSSVVRESEFNSAAATAWVLNPSAIFQSLERSVDWKFLTPTQREDFKKIAKQFIKTKAQNYNIKYNDLVKDYKNAGIDEQWLPTNMAEVVLKSIDWWTTTQSTNQSTNQSTYQSTQSTNRTPSWATKYQNNSSTGGWSTVTVNWNTYPSDFYSNN